MIIRLLIAAAAAAIAVAAQAKPTLEDYGRLPKIEKVTLSPSGDRFAYVGVVGEERTLVAATVDGKALVRAPIGDVKLRALQWAGEDAVLVTFSQTAALGPQFTVRQAEIHNALVVDIAAKSVEPVFKHSRKLLPALVGSYGLRKIDGRWYSFYGAYEDGDLGVRPPNLYRVDLAKTSAERAALGNPMSDDWVVGTDGTVIAYSLYDEKSGRWRLFTGKFAGREVTSRTTLLKGVSIEGLGRTPGTVLLGEIDDEEGDVVREQPLEAGAQPVTLFEGKQVSQLLFDPETALLIGALVDDGRGAVLFNADHQRRFNAAAKALSAYHVSLIDYTADFGRLIVFTDGGDDSGTYWLVDIAAKKVSPLGAAYSAIDPEDVGPTKLVSYTAADKLEMDGVLTLPPGRPAKNLPVVVMPHGGPFDVRDDVGFDWMAQAFASRGYAVFQPNFRGSGGRGAAFRDAGVGEWGKKMQTDISDGLAELVRQGVVDPKRACIVGGSYGGYAALAGVTLQKGLYRCAVSYAGVGDLGDLMNFVYTRAGGTDDTTRYWKLALGSRADMKAYSPADQAAQANAPVLLIHGRDDTVVPLAQSRRMESALKRAGKPVEFIELKGEDHWLSREASRTAMLKASVEFVEKHNPAD